MDASHRSNSRRNRLSRRNALAATAAAFAAVLVSVGCSVEVQNRQPAQQLARDSAPPGSVYTGWRIYQGHCASCHGTDAGGSASAPDLMARVSGMGPRQFVDVVLLRYRWIVAGEGDTSTARETLVEEIVARHAGAVTMPAWRDEPNVNAHVIDLYAYLASRADGSQGPGRPPR